MIEIINDIKNERDYIVNDPYIHEDTSYRRLYVDIKYADRRGSSIILNMIESYLFSKQTRSTVGKLKSYPFSTYRRTDKHETQLTVYGNDGRYHWHYDNDQHRLLSYVLPVDVNKKTWTGGELIIEYNGKNIKIKPKHNQLILFSSHLKHKVLPVKKNGNDLFDGRVVINGHIGFI